MARLVPRQTELAEGSLAHLHADPDARLGLPDGLLVDGHDPFAARRRAMREALSEVMR